jgi:hypothetical protein
MINELKLVRCGCGGEAHHDTVRGWNPVREDAFVLWHRVICKNCGTQTKVFYIEAEAIEAWNKAMGAKDINVPSKNIVTIDTLTTDMNHVGYCKCGYLVNAEWKYCPSCGCRLEWE